MMQDGKPIKMKKSKRVIVEEEVKVSMVAVDDDEDEDQDMEMYEEDKVDTEQVRLTKHLKVVKELPPLYTGGSFVLLKNDKHCLALRDSKICLFNLESSKLLTTIS